MFRKYILCALFMCVGCSTHTYTNSKQKNDFSELEQTQCPVTDDLKGIGSSSNYDKALLLAISDIGRQISSAVTIINQTKKTSNRIHGQENLTSSYTTNSQITVNIDNVQDIHVIKKIENGKKTAIVACMHRKDAIKPYWPLYDVTAKLLLRSLEEYKADEPNRKILAVNTADSAYNDFFKYGALIKGITPSEQRFDLLNQQYFEMQNDFSHFKAEYEIFIKSNKENGFYTDFFNKIAQDNPIKKFLGSCRYGIIIGIDQGELNCDGTLVGTQCSLPININIETCSGKNIFTTSTKLSAVVNNLDSEEIIIDSIRKKETLQPSDELTEFLKNWAIR